MFTTIFKYELKYWLKNPMFYIYLIIFFITALLTAAGIAGAFDGETIQNSIPKKANSPMGIYNIFNTLTALIFFLFPSIIGASIHRDYKSEMHTILYSYPFSKANYLFAKFFSGITIVCCIVLAVGIGMQIGFSLPVVNEDLLVPFNSMGYIQTYLIFLIPNVLYYGAIVFAVVIFSRSITAGFITFIGLILIQILMVSLVSGPDQGYLTGLLNPIGGSAVSYYTKYWTLTELNTLTIPFEGLIIYNRLLWLGIATIIFAIVYRYFSFSQDAVAISFKKPNGKRFLKSNTLGINKIHLPKAKLHYSFIQNLKITWKLSNMDFKYIIKSVAFIAILIFGIFTIISEYVGSESFRGTNKLPTTWQMVRFSEGYLITMMLCTFLFSGMLNSRGKTANINLLLDATPIPNWTLVISKVLALAKMQLLMLFMVMVAGISFQLYKDYTNFEIFHYLFDLFIVNFSLFLLWGLLALFVQTLIKNTYLGMFALMVLFFLFNTPLTRMLGIEQAVFRFGDGSWYQYSDMDGYGDYLSSFFIYRGYWFMSGLLLLIGSSLFLLRGLPNSFRERLTIAKSRFGRKTAVSFALIAIAFLSMGFGIYYENNVENIRITKEEQIDHKIEWELKYRKFKDYVQPRIVAVKVEMNIFPKQLNFNLDASYLMVNKTKVAIDSIFIMHKGFPITFDFDRTHSLVSSDSLFNFEIYRLDKPLQPGDSLKLKFAIKNIENTALQTNSPVLSNGTFLKSSSLFPKLGYKQSDLKNNALRKANGLEAYMEKAYPSDTTALGNSLLSRDSDWITFEATLSTSEDQIAIAPGTLQKEWKSNGRRYFNYKVDGKMVNLFSFNSGRYEVKKDQWKDVDLEIYYHKGHETNLDRMMAGLKASLAYNTKNFGPYQHKVLRIIECPRTLGLGAQAFPNTIPFSESHGFIANVDDSDENGIDYPFAVAVHEVSHQWWAHQVIGANVLGATMLTESISDYIRLKTLEQKYGKAKMHAFLKYALDHYLSGRKNDPTGEKPLQYNSGQQYIRYSKGAVVFYALSDYIGEDKLNTVLRLFLEKNKFQGPPYPTSTDLVTEIKASTPDSLKYIIKDMFETITLYDNTITDFSSKKLDNGKYEVELSFNVRKYRTDGKGNPTYKDQSGKTLSYKLNNVKEPLLSLPLADYIDVGVFGEAQEDGITTPLYLKKHKIMAINNKITLIVDQKPIVVGVDPYYKLIDKNTKDNRKSL